METSTVKQRINNPLYLDTHLETWIEAFLFDRKAQNLSESTIIFYRNYLKLFTRYCDSQLFPKIDQIAPGNIRQYLVWLEDTDHNPGGLHAAYRSLRAFLYWWENEQGFLTFSLFSMGYSLFNIIRVTITSFYQARKTSWI